MRLQRWIDHLPPWTAFGSVLSTGLFSPAELALMAAPLLAGLVVELLRYDLERWRRALELGALAYFLLLLLSRTELVPTVTLTIFALCGARLALPRELAQRRQLLLMGFLLFLTTGISNQDPSFLAWAVVWTALAAGVLLEHAWQRSAMLRRGPVAPPPLRKVLVWTLAAGLLAVPFFLVLPRLALGIRPFVGVGGFGGLRAGFSDTLDLGSGLGPIAGNQEVVLRIKPLGLVDERRLRRLRQSLALLRGQALETVRGQRWEAVPGDPGWPLQRPFDIPAGEGAELLLYPEPSGLLPRPYTGFALEDSIPFGLRILPGGGVGWMLPLRRILTLKVVHGAAGTDGMVFPGLAYRMRGSRRAGYLQTDPEHDAARRWSLREAPGDMAPRQLADRLNASFLKFAYSLENPSGGAANPLQDFLENSRAGHCQYFASALALALRSRGVPSRVVNGFRLGPWNEAGGYFLVTQNEAHSWVEYWDPAIEAWRVADPTPPAPPSVFGESSLSGAFRRWMDAMQYHWDRHVVRFSDEDQMEAGGWARSRFEAIRGKVGNLDATARTAIAFLVLVPLLLFRLRGRWPIRKPAEPPRPAGIKGLKPLLRRTSKAVPPQPSETLRAWMRRLAEQRPDRAGPLRDLLDAAEGVAYGSRPDPGLRRLATEEAKHWR